MKSIVTGWVPDHPDRNDFTLQSLVEAGDFRIIEALENRENDIIALLNHLIDQSSADDTTRQISEKLKQHYNSMVVLQPAQFVPDASSPASTHTIKTVPHDYLKTFYQLAFPHSRQTLNTLVKAQPAQFQAVIDVVYPLIESATILAAPINRFNSRKKNMVFLIHNLYLPLALSALQHLQLNDIAASALPWAQISQRADFRERYLAFRTFASVTNVSDGGDDGVAMQRLCDEIWQTLQFCYQAVGDFECLQSPEGDHTLLQQDILQFIKNSLYFFDVAITPQIDDKLKELFRQPKLTTRPPTRLASGDVFLLAGQAIDQEATNEKNVVKSTSLQPLIHIPILRSQAAPNTKDSWLRLPSSVDLTPWCSPIENQGTLQACSSHAAIALVEYFHKRSAQGYYEASRLFLYKVTRDLMQVTGNVGTSLRETMKAMVLFGTPPEKYWPYDETRLDTHPGGFCFAYAQNYQALKYFRLDPLKETNKLALLLQIKALLAAGFPCAFGFSLYRSAYLESLKDGDLPLPCADDLNEGGHALVAVGYADDHVVLNADGEPCCPPVEIATDATPNPEDKYFAQGAFLIRNCWGNEWGDHGYGWLPYAYIQQGLTSDWWSLVKAEWLNTAQFGLGSGSQLGDRQTSTDVQTKQVGNSANG
ncbi:C1 family peptidase [Halomicronema sp. CCY15110]|uniref:C1 family peptidase n=1 Tax=Halomicronema sp. CCY15110 TaxID=2767773 RepID=UPI00194FAA36|nr:C1 family peptidase [Halomicronema sp. CCY15110]